MNTLFWLYKLLMRITESDSSYYNTLLNKDSWMVVRIIWLLWSIWSPYWMDLGLILWNFPHTIYDNMVSWKQNIIENIPNAETLILSYISPFYFIISYFNSTSTLKVANIFFTLLKAFWRQISHGHHKNQII
jgi:hypothetical protein